jgi:hypothetical protein
VKEIDSRCVALIVDWYAEVAGGTRRRVTTLQFNINKIHIITYAIIVNVF